MTDLSRLETHFHFGENWREFARLIDADRLDSAAQSMHELVGSEITDSTFLDIGCGSGLSSLAAAKLGAKSVLATDIDPASTATAKALLASHLPAHRFEVRTISVFDLRPEAALFDVVYSWGVLHHTGAMWSAIEHASQFTKPNGIFVLAIYKKTAFCGLWRREKKFYAHSSRWVQNLILNCFRVALYGALLTRGRNPWRRNREYSRRFRGMSEVHDFHDWLGGFPYESATPVEIDRFLSARGFRFERGRDLKRVFGLFGTGCAEYVYRRVATKAVST